MSFITNNLTIDLLGILIGLVCIWIVHINYRLNYWKRKNFQYLEPTFLFGNLPNPLSNNKKPLGVHFEDLYNQVKQIGHKIAGVYFSTSPGLVVTDLNLVKQVLSKDFQFWMSRGLYYNEEKDPLTAHLVVIDGNKWKNLRRKMTPTFTSGKMKSMFPILVQCSYYLEEQVRTINKKGEPLNIMDILGNFTTDVIGSCAFGLECKSFETSDSLFRFYGKKSFEEGFWMALKFRLSLSFPELCRKIGLTMLNKDVSNFFMKTVRDTIDYREENKVMRKDFLQLMMDMKDEDVYKGDGNTLTFNEIASQCFVFFAAGFETSSTAMTFALFELSRNPEIQERAREEVLRVLKKYNGEFTYDGLQEMGYLSQVIDESLRFYPPVPLIGRVCSENYKFPESDIVIEKGTRVMISISGIHHDPDYHKNPFTFDPDRFSEENRQKIHPFAFIPFGEGPRICIGLRFGQMQAKVGLARLLSKFRFTLSKKTQLPLKMVSKVLVQNCDETVFLDCEEI